VTKTLDFETDLKISRRSRVRCRGRGTELSLQV